MRVRVDPDSCEGHGECVDACPEIFQFVKDDDEIVTVLDAEPSDTDIQAKVRKAASACPVAAIEVDD